MRKKVFSFLILREQVVAKDFPDRKLPGRGGQEVICSMLPRSPFSFSLKQSYKTSDGWMSGFRFSTLNSTNFQQKDRYRELAAGD